ncbi:arf-GAP with coiled-coil, ANK repeat and PH domain-containing protein 2 [Anopheles funestus]|uniref:arf-GAP with coiled-coil, ANK repeat and PH domain-containing protein 2 n=1 Tax=Anopheles funestus TaxID=62324 RepID=UPI0020C72C0F|nr:arf-GAP with coiled-coil, ANK repeat and PH domain-containing protein 2 [Anopheles funestus]XP_049292487.1 arf-GAP with coiled-coil, ANK repeat and PH domain-containing protein 2 [Anopheles funestus]XP_049292576.1 arf-GAP with coiled-coil, ANK repeat and PH domain-containing protein 2 [Anopheles funestus]XP_049292648.1 arf-GAP with coiled-coil, ANK repeat and PH domain-containing protein 2 [Anopheles funestus]
MAQCKIDFGECLKDSPKFRLRLEQEETEIEHLESRLEKIIKACSAAVDSGKEYIRHQSTFATSLWDLQKHFQDSKNSTNALAQLIQLLQEMNMFHTTLLDQANRTVLKNLTGFLKRDIREVKEYRQIFTKVSENLDAAVYKNSQVSRNRPADVLEAENVLSASKSCFNHTALDYVNYITLLQNRKRHEILGTLLSYLKACSTYFHQGSDLCEDYGTFFKGLDDEIGLMRSEYGVLDKQMQNRHTCVNDPRPEQQEACEESTSASDGGATGGDGGGGGSDGGGGRFPNYMEGYLFKRTSNAFKTWNRRWFCMRDNQLFYRKRTGEELPTVMEEDLRLCTVRPLADSDRRYCFEVISPAKSHILQADSEAMMNAWIKALQKGIDSAIQHNSAYSSDMRGVAGGGGAGNSGAGRGPGGSTSAGDGNRAGDSRMDSSGNKQRSGTGRGSEGTRKGYKKINWTQMLKIPGNSRCADCGNADPRWASINLGITLCIACSGVHRSLGVHYSKVRSLTLDVWEPEILRVMIELGNDVINRVYEGNKTRLARFDRATDNCEIAVREAWIRAKYIDRQFVVPLGGGSGTGPDDSSTSSSTLSFKSLGADSSKFPEKWSIKKLRRRSYRQLLRRPNQSKEQQSDAAGSQPITNLDDDDEDEDREAEDVDDEERMGSRSKGCPDADEKDVLTHVPKQFADILLIGENILTDDHNLPDEDLLLLNSDQESTSGEEDNAIMECEELERLSPNYLLYKAASGHNLPVMSQALALGAEKSWPNVHDADRTPLHAAILSGSVMSCEFLLLNGAAINAIDRYGRTPLHLAAEQGSAAQAYLLLKHKARYDIADVDGRRPIDIAVEKEDADIVTLLRLTLLNDEIGSGEDGESYAGGDSTYVAVMNEFSHLASNQPQRLQRNRHQQQQQQQQQRQALVTTDDTNPIVTDLDAPDTGSVISDR